MSTTGSMHGEADQELSPGQNQATPPTTSNASGNDQPATKPSSQAGINRASATKSLMAQDIGLDDQVSGPTTTQAGNYLFRIHYFKLMEFQGLSSKMKETIKDAKSPTTIKFRDSDHDVRHTLTVLYSTAYNPHPFSATILKSALRIATKYAHPTLRAFAIGQLEQHHLEPIERFSLSRDCGVTQWMSNAVDDLCWRDEPIVVSEAEILGPKVFVEIAARREATKFERGARLGLPEVSLKHISGTTALAATIAQPTPQELRNIPIASNTIPSVSKTSLAAPMGAFPDLGSSAPALSPTDIKDTSTAKPSKTCIAPPAPTLAGRRVSTGGFSAWGNIPPLPFTFPIGSNSSTSTQPMSILPTSNTVVFGAK